MNILHATEYYTDEGTEERFAGCLLMDGDIETVVNDTCTVLKPDGTPLLIFLKGGIPADICKMAYPAFLRASQELTVSNRGLASGRVRFTQDVSHLFRGSGEEINETTRLRPIKMDGTFSNTSYAIFSDRIQRVLEQHNIDVELQLSSGEWVKRANTPLNGVVGYMDKNSRYPYCRMTAFSLNNPKYHRNIIPYAQTVNDAFRDHLPDRFAAQQAAVNATDEHFYISGTVFTTITVNMNFATAVHKDAGDLKAGFGVMSALRKGQYTGGYTSFPRYRTGVNMETGDILLADVHEWHGNTPITPKGPFERIATVFYFREKMQECDTPAANLETAKQKKGLAHLKDWQ